MFFAKIHARARYFTICVFLASHLCIATGSALAAQKTIRPGHVYQTLITLHSEIEKIGYHLKVPANHEIELEFSNAQPREVIFQAHQLFQLADQLAFEKTYTRETMPVANLTQTKPADVLKVVQKSVHRVQLVSEHLGLPLSKTDELLDIEDITPNDVYASITRANQRINRLIEHKTTTNEIYSQVTHAVSLASRILSAQNTKIRIPDPIPNVGFQPTPEVLYQSLLRCYELLYALSNNLGVNMLTMKTNMDEPSFLLSNEDLDQVATLLVSELTYLHSLHPKTKPPVEKFAPGDQQPEDLMERISILDQQLTLLSQITTNRSIAATGVNTQ